MERPMKAVRIQSVIDDHRASLPSAATLSDVVIAKEPDTSSCHLFQDIQSFAERFVNDIVDEAEDLVLSKRSSLLRKHIDKKSFCFSNDFESWPSIEEFTVETGAKKISEYLSSFSLKEEWLYAIFYVGMTRNLCSDFHHYESVWSLPTARYPIVQATASVYFTIEVSRIVPRSCPVTATFCLESNRLNHNPSIDDFTDTWLNWILDAKIKNFQRYTF